MRNSLYLLGKRLIISNSRRCVRGSVIFLVSHLLLLIGIAFAVAIAMVVLGVENTQIPFAGKLFNLIPTVLK